MKILDGQRFAFVGDSITEADPGYARLTAAMLGALYPDRQIEYIYAGVGGNRVTDLLERIGRDVLDHQPDWISISIGINDVWHSFHPGLTGVPLADFQPQLRQLLDEIAARSQARLVLMTPTVIGEELTNDENRQLAPYVEVIRAEATARKAILCDTHAAFRRAIAAAAGRRRFTTDGVHLNPVGNALMAQTLLAALRRG